MRAVCKTTFSTEIEQNTILERFWAGFGDHLGPCWAPLDTFGARGRLFFVFFRIDFSIGFFMDFEVSAAPQKRNSAAQELLPLVTW